MSHFSTIKTKLKDKKILVKALQLVGERPNVPSDLGMSVVDLVITNPSHAEEHPTTEVELSIGPDIGFRLNPKTGTYDLVADRQTWNKDVPIERFVDKLTQQYALTCLIDSSKEEGYEIEKQSVTNEGSIELTLTKWN